MNAELRAQLHAGLLARGYLVEATHDDPQSFGSWYTDYIHVDKRVRLIWDGRDQQFVLQGGTQWRDLAVKRPADLIAAGVDAFLSDAE